MTKEINFFSKSHEYGFLSNFWPCLICSYQFVGRRGFNNNITGGIRKGVFKHEQWYLSSEHFYQSMKILTPYWNMKNLQCPTIMTMEFSKALSIHRWIANAPDPYYAFKAGRSLRKKDGFIQADFDKIKVDVMRHGLSMKFENPELRQKLLDTDDAILHEDSPTDMFWGKKGKDMLGKLLMELREQIKEEDQC